MDKENNKARDKKCYAGIGIAILAATAAAGYFLYGTKQGAKNRKKIKGWMLKAKGEVLEKIEKLKDISEEEYNNVIDIVSAKYSKIKSIDEKDVQNMMNDLRKHWKNIQKHIEPKKRKAVRTAKKAINKAAKAAVKKTTEKRSSSKKSSQTCRSNRGRKRRNAKKLIFKFWKSHQINGVFRIFNLLRELITQQIYSLKYF